ncbi:MAG TPA: serpin family protein [Lacipirellulaceae bacterium]
MKFVRFTCAPAAVLFAPVIFAGCQMREPPLFQAQEGSTTRVVATEEAASGPGVSSVTPISSAGQPLDASEAASAAQLKFEEAIFQKMQQKVDWRLADETLSSFASRLSKALGVPVNLDKVGFEEAGVDSQTPFSDNLDGLILEIALDQVLNQFDFDWTIAGNAVLISSRDEIDERLTTRVYAVDDLLKQSDFEPDFDLLISAIEEHIDSSSWASNGGGEATVTPFQAKGIDVLIVTQTVRTHRKVAQLFSDLRVIRKEGDDAKPRSVDISELRKLLGASQIQGDVDAPAEGTPIADVGDTTELPQDSAGMTAAVRRCNQFSLELFQKAAREANRNQLVSGYSAREALSILALGSSGRTEQEFARVLKLHDEHMAGAIELLSLRSQLLRGRAVGSEFHAANSIWIDQELEFVPEFAPFAEKFMGASARRIDFRKVDDVVSEVNRWSADNTEQRIPVIIGRDDVGDATLMLVANAVYFHGKWETPFDVKRTAPHEFALSSGDKADVEMMIGEVSARFGVDEDSGTQIAELPYEGKLQSLVILLPADREGALTRVKELLDAESLEDWLRELPAGKVKIHLPKFSFHAAYDLSTSIAELGGDQMFDLARSDFSRISNSPLAVEKVIQKTFIQVDELGTEAAAATKGGAFGAVAPLRTPEFIVNRPFIFLIRDVSSGCVLFVGRIVDPRLSQ